VNEKGIVHLIGAGPGDPGLLTIRAKEIIETADVIVYDYLANEEFLDYAREDAEFEYVGKKGGDHTKTQDQINALIIDHAKAGRSVARLKGGDPFVFGRGGEEAEELVAAGAPFEIVPGVTAGVAAAAYAGIPVTHRDFTPSVAFITGHEDPNKQESAHHWEAYAKSTSTLVFYMGVKNLPMIAQKLIEAGRPADEPAAIIRWGATCRQRSLVSTLEKLPAEAEKLGFKAPSIIVVGGVCGLKSKLNWFENRPLLGKGVVVTRAREQASELAARLRDLGACVIQFPTIAIRELSDYSEVESEILALQSWDWIVFTSVNGVKHFFRQLGEIGLDARVFGGLDVAAIGPATADALRERGINPDFVPDKYVAEHVVEGLLEKGVKGKRVLIPRAKVAREVLPEQLAEAGAEVKVLPVYETVLAEENADKLEEKLAEGEVHYVTFTSSSTVENFFTLLAPEVLKRYEGAVKLAAIGPVTAKTLEGFGFTADIQPEDYTIPGLVAALVER
jgi:uroporphyrinogen III methyltransferase/synthase